MDDLLWERMKKLIREQAPESPPQQRPPDPDEVREALELARKLLGNDKRRTTVQDGDDE